MPMHPGVPNAPHGGAPHSGAPNTPNNPNTPNQPGHSNQPGHGNQPGHNNPPAHDGGNDPKFDDPLARQIEIDRLKPDYMQPGPNKPRSVLDSHDHLPSNPMDPRRFDLQDAVAGHPLRNLFRWAHKVNPDNGPGRPQFGMNCPDVSRAVCEILNGEPPRLAHGNRYASGENPDTTLEWMGLRDVPAANKFHRPPGHDGDWSLDQAAYQKVRDALAGRPPGTHANIGVYYVGGGGHRFTAFVDENGAMKWLDAQPSDAARKLPEGSPEQLAQIQRDMVKHSNQVPLASHIQQLDFAVREPGGKWEGEPRRPTDPPASQTRWGAPRPFHSSQTPGTPHTPDLPEGSHVPETSGAPGASGTPGIAHALSGRPTEPRRSPDPTRRATAHPGDTSQLAPRRPEPCNTTTHEPAGVGVLPSRTRRSRR